MFLFLKSFLSEACGGWGEEGAGGIGTTGATESCFGLDLSLFLSSDTFLFSPLS